MNENDSRSMSFLPVLQRINFCRGCFIIFVSGIELGLWLWLLDISDLLSPITGGMVDTRVLSLKSLLPYPPVGTIPSFRLFYDGVDRVGRASAKPRWGNMPTVLLLLILRVCWFRLGGIRAQIARSPLPTSGLWPRASYKLSYVCQDHSNSCERFASLLNSPPAGATKAVCVAQQLNQTTFSWVNLRDPPISLRRPQWLECYWIFARLKRRENSIQRLAFNHHCCCPRVFIFVKGHLRTLAVVSLPVCLAGL